MIYRRRVITALGVAFALSAGAYADMMPAFHVDATPQPSARVCGEPSPPPANACSPLIDPIAVDLDSLSFAFLPRTDVSMCIGIGLAGEMQESVPLLARERGSFHLCLYALMGLGLCKSAPWVKKLNFGGIPDWYHHGGPSQIGHRHAVGPNCLCSAPVCFIQPDCRAEDSILRYRLGTLASLWRNSQFTPSTLACRGPPLSSAVDYLARPAHSRLVCPA